MMGKLVVIGSSNTDMVIITEGFTKAGETVLGGDFFTFRGLIVAIVAGVLMGFFYRYIASSICTSCCYCM